VVIVMVVMMVVVVAIMSKNTQSQYECFPRHRSVSCCEHSTSCSSHNPIEKTSD
jgi:hypothetical protein